MITRQLEEIPGASYIETVEDTGTMSATVLLPFPLSGEYSVKIVPKDNAISTDTYGLDVTRAGVTTILAKAKISKRFPISPIP